MIRLARHGESTWNLLDRIQGHADAPVLTARGRAQAHDLARQLAGRPVAQIFSSDLRRAALTAAAISDATGVVVVTDQRLRERAMGALEGAPRHCAIAAVSGLSGGQVLDASARPPGGESLHQLHARVVAFLSDHGISTGGDAVDSPGRHLPPPTGDTVIVAHGGTVRMLVAALGGMVVEAMSWEPVPNATVRDIRCRPTLTALTAPHTGGLQ